MTDIQAKALKLFSSNHNCSQSVLSALSSKIELPEQIALGLASGFGAGICFQGQTCGAVTAAYMALGLKSGRKFSGGEDIKENTYQLIAKFNTEFKQKYSSTQCNTLLGVDMSTPEGVNKAKDNGLFESQCPEYVKTAVDICSQLLDHA